MDNPDGLGLPGSRRWLGFGARLLITLACLVLLFAVNRCGLSDLPSFVFTPTAVTTTGESRDVPTQPVTPPPSATASTPAQDLPDLLVKFVSIELESGGACNFASTELGTRAVVQNAGQGDAGPFVVQVHDAQHLIPAGLAAGKTLSLWFPGSAYGGETSVTVDANSQVVESDESNNTFLQMVPIPTLPPTCTPSPTGRAPTQPPTPPTTDTPQPSPTHTPQRPPTNTPKPSPTHTPTPPAVAVRQGQVTIATYPFAGFTTQAWNETYRMPYAVLNREAYQASNPTPLGVTYDTLVVENEYLKLTFLPDVGGRLYEVIYKPTGHRETYRNPVLKPSPWGPPEQLWWLAAGGFEWCVPVEEHGYEWGVPWTTQVSRDASGATVTMSDTAAGDRVRATIAVRLEVGAGSFTIRPRLENPTGAPLAVKYWTNAMLAPGGQNAPSASLRFVLPDTVAGVTVHSRGDPSLPDYNQRMAWPTVNGRDLSRLGNWTAWLGFFEDPALGEFSGVYDELYDEGMVRVSSPALTPGVKMFAFGWSDPIPSSIWTDDGSSYIELHGGPVPTFDDNVNLPAGGSLEWTETWFPAAGLGGLRYANDLAALNLGAGGGQAQLAVAVTRAWSGTVALLLDSHEQWHTQVSLKPGKAYRTAVPLDANAPQAGQLTLRLVARDGSTAAEYSAQFKLK